MRQNSFENLVLLNIENDLLNYINKEKILDNFLKYTKTKY